MQLTRTLIDNIMAAVTAAAGPIDDADTFLGAFTAINDQGLATTLADLTLPPGALATAVDIGTFNAAYFLQNGQPVRDADPVTIRPASSAEATTVIGWYIANAAAAGDLLAFGYFAGPIPLPDEFSAVTVILRVTIPDVQGWDVSINYNG